MALTVTPPSRVPMPPLRPPPQPPRPAPEVPVTAPTPAATLPDDLRSYHARIVLALAYAPLSLEQLAEQIGLSVESVDTYMRALRRMGLVEPRGTTWHLTAAGARVAALDRTAELAEQHRATQARRAKPKASAEPGAPRKAAAPKPAAPAVEVTPPAPPAPTLSARVVGVLLEVAGVTLEVRDPEALRRWLA